MFNGTRRKSASPIGASPSLDMLAFIRTVKGGTGARKQLLLAAKSTCPHSFPGHYGNRRQFLCNVFQAACQNLPFYNSKCDFRRSGTGPRCRAALSILGSHPSLGEGRVAGDFVSGRAIPVGPHCRTGSPNQRQPQ